MDLEEIKRKYRRNVHFYDWFVRPTRKLRQKAVDALGLCPGQSVLDFGCGTGLSLEMLQDAVGTQGRIVGVDLSPDMLERAEQRACESGWENVQFIEANAEEVDLSEIAVDAVLCFYTHDITNSRHALEKAIGALRVGGRFVTAGAKRSGGFFGSILGFVTLLYSIPFITNLSGTRYPWKCLEELIGQLDVEEYAYGSSYVACGIKKS